MLRATVLIGTFLAVACVAATGEPATTAVPAPVATTGPLDVAMQQFQTDRPAIEGLVGKDVARDLFLRLDGDIEDQQSERPANFPAADWAETLATTQRLDVDAERQLAAGSPRGIAFAPGLHEDFVRSSVDGTMQPVAVYVPPQIASDAHASSAIVLHGHDQSETELLAQPYLRSLADATGTIFVAPYGRGLYDFAPPGESDIRDAFAAARAALPVDPSRAYLVGYSMGAFTVYIFGPHAPPHWKAVMAIAGSMMNDNAAEVVAAFARTPVYVITGTDD